MKICFSAERGVSHVTDGGKIPPRRRAFEAAPTRAWIQRLQGYLREMGNLLPHKQPASARHMLRNVPDTVPRVGRSYEHFPDGFELHLLPGAPHT